MVLIKGAIFSTEGRDNRFTNSTYGKRAAPSHPAPFFPDNLANTAHPHIISGTLGELNAGLAIPPFPRHRPCLFAHRSAAIPLVRTDVPDQPDTRLFHPSS